MRLSRERFTVRGVVIAAVVLIVILAVSARWWQNDRKTAAVIQLAARQYQEESGKPFPRPYRFHRKKAASRYDHDEITYACAQWEASKKAYLVKLVWIYLVNDVRDRWGNPIPFETGATAVDSYLVKEDGTCEHLGTQAGGEW